MTRPISFSAIFLLLILSLPIGQLSAQAFFEFPAASPFNQKVVQPPDSAWSYAFLTGGHLYGAHGNAHSLYPAASFLGNFKRINSNPVALLISLGDLQRTSKDPKVIAATQLALKGLDIPVYNVPGNHDLDDRVAYEKAFSIARNTFFAKEGEATNHFGFFIKDDYFLLLDTELLLEERHEQVRQLIGRETARLTTRKVKPRNIFVFSHRLLWALCDDALAAADGLANEPLSSKVDVKGACDIVAKIEALPRSRELYWFSGDVGADWSVPLIYAQNEAKKAHYIASGIGDQPDDALVQTTISAKGDVRLKVFPLTDQKWDAVESYDLAYWAAQPRPESAGGDGFAAKVSAALSSKKFWAGLAGGLLIGALGIGLIRRKRG